MKVYGGNLFPKDAKYKQTRCIIAAKSQSQVAKLTNASLYYIRNYWGETGNKKELEVARAKPEVLFWFDAETREYREVVEP